jgi:acetylornithine deacetylase/succinyl-diaminopimelate desuccinylase-like protein
MRLSDLLGAADAARDEIVALAGDLIGLDTTNTGTMPTGGETIAAEFLRDRLLREGIDEVDLLARDAGRANLVARLPGDSNRSRLLLLGHTDVVPAGDSASWTHAPFGGEVDGNRIYGRGAADMKGTVAAQLMALILLQRASSQHGRRLRHSVRLAAVADEEAGGAYGMGWLISEHADRLSAEICLNEGGGHFVRLGDADHCVLGLGEKGRYEAVFTFRGSGAHASQPWRGSNAFFPLARVLRRIESYEPQRDARLPIFNALYELLGSRLQMPPLTAANVDEFVNEVEMIDLGIAGDCRALSRLTIVPTLVSGGVKSNSVPERVELRCDVRSLPHQDRGYLERELASLASGIPGIEVRLETTAEASQSPYDPRIAAALSNAVTRAVGRRVELLPGLGTGFTDSRFFRKLGRPALGFTPGDPRSPDESRKSHGTDEWTTIDDLVAMTRFFLAAAVELDTLELPEWEH